MSDDGPKREAAHAAVQRYVESGMVVGLGTGSTATFAVRRIGELVASGELRDIRGVPTSAKTTALANELGIPLATLAEVCPRFTIDGADEISPELALIKGRGGALLREKIVASSSEEGLIVVADSSWSTLWAQVPCRSKSTPLGGRPPSKPSPPWAASLS